MYAKKTYGGPGMGRPKKMRKVGQARKAPIHSNLAASKGGRRYLRFGPQGGGGLGEQGKRQRRYRRMRQGKPVGAPSEDSLAPALTEKLVKRGYTYGEKGWYLPKNPGKARKRRERERQKRKNKKDGWKQGGPGDKWAGGDPYPS